jgi:hypothetical protein
LKLEIPNSAARGAKADHLKSSYAGYGDRFESVKITDIAHDQFPEALVGVDAIIHLASPLPGRAEPAALLAVCRLTKRICRPDCSCCRLP